MRMAAGWTGDYAGLPLSDAGRWRAQSWVPENFEVAELVCRPHAFDFSLEAGAARLRWVPDIEDSSQKLVAYHGRLSMREQENTIWMDDRPRPPDYVRHSWSGFTTGVFEGDTLVQTSTHLKEAYIRRWGPMRSDRATVRYRWKRLGNYLRATVIIYDPVYLAEPYVRTSLFWVRPRISCSRRIPVKKRRRRWWNVGGAPHALPGQSFLPAQGPEAHGRVRNPVRAEAGGPETMYPEYIAKMKTLRDRQRSREAGSGANDEARDPAQWCFRSPVSGSWRREQVHSQRAPWAWTPAIATQSTWQIQILPVRGNVDAARRRRQRHRARRQRRDPDG